MDVSPDRRQSWQLAIVIVAAAVVIVVLVVVSLVTVTVVASVVVFILCPSSFCVLIAFLYFLILLPHSCVH